MSSDGIVVPPPGKRGTGDDVRIEQPDGAFVICEWLEEMVRAAPGIPIHVHREDEEAWHVIDGILRFVLGDREVDAPAGTTVMAPRGVPHTFWNPGPGPARYLIILTPNTLHLIDELHALDSPSQGAIEAVWRSHASELVPS